MKNISIESEITTTTTVTAVDITFTKEGKEYTAKFKITSIHDAGTDTTKEDVEIINQEEMLALTDYEDDKLWIMAKYRSVC